MKTFKPVSGNRFSGMIKRPDDFCCDWCEQPIENEYYDARTIRGYWGNFCPDCFGFQCIGLGTGLGQKYAQVD